MKSLGELQKEWPEAFPANKGRWLFALGFLSLGSALSAIAGLGWVALTLWDGALSAQRALVPGLWALNSILMGAFALFGARKEASSAENLWQALERLAKKDARGDGGWGKLMVDMCAWSLALPSAALMLCLWKAAFSHVWEMMAALIQALCALRDAALGVWATVLSQVGEFGLALFQGLMALRDAILKKAALRALDSADALSAVEDELIRRQIEKLRAKKGKGG